jgi:integrase/recombinase XerD
MRRRAYVPSTTEMTTLLDYHKEPRIRLALMLGHLAGLRVMEIAKLKVSDVQYADGRYKASMHILGKRKKWRVVPISDRLKIFIDLARRDWQTMDSPLVHNTFGKHYNPVSLSHFHTLWYKAAGIDEGKGNSGRRSFMSRLHKSGVSLAVIKELAGHRSLQTTQVYLEVDETSMSDAVNIL